MRAFLDSVWDVVYQLFVWFVLVIGFFIGLFLMGLVTGFLINIFMAGFRLL
jgi:hypothetical protein